MNLNKLKTEQRNKNTFTLDEMNVKEIVTIMNQEDKKVAYEIEKEIDNIASAVSIVEKAFNNGGRLIYIGAGTSGRLGVLDAAECLPTFGVSDKMVIAIIAGGDRALRYANENAEDDSNLAKKSLSKLELNESDVVCGIVASGRTPYVIGGLKYAQSQGAKTIAISCNKDSEAGKIADLKIEVDTGPEVLTGSTRLKAGTAQKMILNMISTGAMVRIGKTYQNLMVDVIQTNKKLVERTENIVMEATGVTREEAKQKLKIANDNAKTAIVMILLDCDLEDAIHVLKKAKGHVKEALKIGNNF